MIDRLIMMREELLLWVNYEGGNYFLRGEIFSYDDFEAFRMVLCGGLGPGRLVAGRCFILAGCRMAFVVLMTLLLPLPIRGAVLPHPRPIPTEALNSEYGIRRKTVV
jgi:hypothetical protein